MLFVLLSSAVQTASGERVDTGVTAAHPAGVAWLYQSRTREDIITI
jgi:hypothetical protein